MDFRINARSNEPENHDEKACAGAALMLAVLRQFAHFSGVGLISATGHFGLLITLVQEMQVTPVAASAAGALLGAIINYSLNYHFTFRSRKRHREAALKFSVVAAIGLLLNTLLMWTGVELLGLHYLIGQIITTGLVLIWSFIGNRYWSFHVAARLP